MAAETTSPPIEPTEPPVVKKKRKWIKRTIITVVAIIVVLLGLIIGVLLYFHIPSNSAGLAAQTVCSGTFTSGRNAQEVFDNDVLPQNPALKLISFNVDEPNRTVTTKFLGLFERRAALLTNRGCVLNADPDPSSQPYKAPAANPAPWPAGTGAVPQAQWGQGVNAAGLDKVVADAFVGAGDPEAGNARGLAIVQNGKLLVQKQGEGFPTPTPLLGWSMTKTVNMMIMYKRALETNYDLNNKLVINAFPANREPSWVASWRSDAKKSLIKISDLVGMKSGLDMADD